MTMNNDTEQMIPTETWSSFYRGRSTSSSGRYPTEWVVRTLAGGNYPKLKLDKRKYLDARILDLGCGDGRNLPLLLNLGFDVHACETSPSIVKDLQEMARELNWSVNFTVGLNSRLSYPDNYFDYMLCCSSCYYLDSTLTWPIVRTELARVIKPGGFLVANFPDKENAVLANSLCQSDGSLLITNDPFGIRNGTRFMAVESSADITSMLSPEFQVLATGFQNDDFYGLRVSAFLTVSQRL
jgi:SAM-dependent methyltransferase